MAKQQTHILRPDWYADGTPDPLTATGKALRWGVVSTGSIAHSVTGDLALLADAELQAVSSRDAGKATAFAEEFGFRTSYADQDGVPGYQRMCQDPEVDVVYIGTPHGQHFEVAEAALRAGKHVLCEKALTINAREAEALVRLAGTQGVFFMEALWSRFVPGVQRALEIVAAGELGSIRWVRADLGFPAPRDLSSRIWAPEAGGGALLDLTVYPLLWAWGMLGAPERVQATRSITEWGVDEQNAITLGYPDGALAQLMSSFVAQGPRTASIAGTEGFMETEGSMNNPSALKIRAGWNGSGWDVERTEEFTWPGRGYVYELREVTRCIQAGKQQSPTMPWQDSLDIMRFLDQVREQLGVRYPNDLD